MEGKIQEITEKINSRIRIANDQFTGWDERHAQRMEKIDGMIDVLEILTGKRYTITENGLEEIAE